MPRVDSWVRAAPRMYVEARLRLVSRSAKVECATATARAPAARALERVGHRAQVSVESATVEVRGRAALLRPVAVAPEVALAVVFAVPVARSNLRLRFSARRDWWH